MKYGTKTRYDENRVESVNKDSISVGNIKENALWEYHAAGREKLRRIVQMLAVRNGPCAAPV
jgi:hypothetical protein